jgi:hypothetical protein
MGERKMHAGPGLVTPSCRKPISPSLSLTFQNMWPIIPSTLWSPPPFMRSSQQSTTPVVRAIRK